MLFYFCGSLCELSGRIRYDEGSEIGTVHRIVYRYRDFKRGIVIYDGASNSSPHGLLNRKINTTDQQQGREECAHCETGKSMGDYVGFFP